MKVAVHQAPLDRLTKKQQESIHTQLEAPPRGYRWLWLEQQALALLVPSGWQSYTSEGKSFHMPATRFVLAPQPVPSPVAFIATVFSHVFTHKEGPAVTAKDVARFVTALHMRRMGPPGAPDKDTPGVEVVGTWAQDLGGGMEAFGLEYITKYPDYDTMLETPTHARHGRRQAKASEDNADAASASAGVSAGAGTDAGEDVDGAADGEDYATDMRLRWGMRFHINVVANKAADLAWKMVFQAPDAEWDEAWGSHGAAMMDGVVIDWRKSRATAHQSVPIGENTFRDL